MTPKPKSKDSKSGSSLQNREGGTLHANSAEGDSSSLANDFVLSIDSPNAESQGIRSLPLETQTLYSELLEHLHVDQLRRSIGSLQGTFAQREKSGVNYWYFRTSEGPESRAMEFYIGQDNDETRALIQGYKMGRGTAKESEARVIRLSAMLRSGGITLTDAPTAKII